MCSLHAKYKQYFLSFFTVCVEVCSGFKGQVAGDKVCLTIDFCLECMFVHMSMYVWRTAHTQLN